MRPASCQRNEDGQNPVKTSFTFRLFNCMSQVTIATHQIKGEYLANSHDKNKLDRKKNEHHIQSERQF